MHRTEGANNINNLFNDGPPGTTVTGAWCNAVQEEISTVIEEAGITLKQQSNDTDWNQLYSAINQLITPGIITVTSTNSPYTINDTLKNLIVYVDSSGGNIVINYPDLASNYNKKISIIHSIGGNNLTIQRAGSDLITKDNLTSIELPKEGNYLEVLGEVLSNRWDVIQEYITCQLRLNTYAGYGSVDNKIMRFTNVVDNYGNLFSENHSTGYNGNAEGLKITINKSGKYLFVFSVVSSNALSILMGLSLNSAQLTTNIESINVSDRLSIITGVSSGGVAGVGSVTWSEWLKKGDIVRSHANAVIPANASLCHFTATYLGK
jgi:hypothetical protein